MKTNSLYILAALALTSLLGTPHTATAKTTPPAEIVSPIAAATSPATDTRADTDTDDTADATAEVADAKDEHDNTIISIGHDSNLASGERATTMVSVFGSSTSAGTVDEAVVSVLGDTRVTGSVGEAAVAVLGSTYVDSHVGEDVVAVLGNVELGPHADIAGDVVAVGGELKRDPAAVVHGTTQNVALFGHMGSFTWLHPWIQHCLVYGRPLAFVPGIGWAWTLALSFLALYLLIALLFPQGINQCVRTMEAQPGRTVLASLLTFLCKPFVLLLLLITVIGAILVPFLMFALFIAGLFGKAVALAWLGRRVIPAREDAQEPLPVLAVLIGGGIALLLYVVPVLGFITYKALDVLGLGIVVYTLLLAFRATRAARPTQNGPSAIPPASTPPPAAATAEPPSPEPLSAAAASTEAPASPATPKPLSIDYANRAGFWLRMAALLIDFILVGIVTSGLPLFSHQHLLLGLAAYGAVMWKLKGTTIGGIICGLRVVRLDGRAIDWPTAVSRALGCFLSAVVAGLGFIWVVFDSERQSWHDKIAGTVVVRAPRGTPLV